MYWPLCSTRCFHFSWLLRISLNLLGSITDSFLKILPMCSFLTPSLLLLYSGSQHVGGSLIAQSPSFLRPHGLYPARSSIHGISQARILEWVAISFSRAFFYPRNRTQVSCIAGGFLHCRQIVYWLSYMYSLTCFSWFISPPLKNTPFTCV